MLVRNLVVAIAVLSSAHCAPFHLSHEASNPLLKELAREDQEVRMGTDVARTDEERIVLVLKELGAGRVISAEDKFDAALVLQHSPLALRGDSIVAVSPDNYLLAHELAREAFARGHAPARLLVAQTLDRYLSLTRGYQKFGTNRFINQRTGREELAPIDRSTTDDERARYGVAPLVTLLGQFPESGPPP